MSTETADRILSTARNMAGLTWAEFDYALLSDGVGTIDMAVGAEVYRRLGAAVPGLSEAALAARNDMAHTLWEQVRGAIEERKTVARERGFTGWASASDGPIRYAS